MVSWIGERFFECVVFGCGVYRGVYVLKIVYVVGCRVFKIVLFLFFLVYVIVINLFIDKMVIVFWLFIDCSFEEFRLYYWLIFVLKKVLFYVLVMSVFL